MRRNAVLGVLVHVARADLHLQRLAPQIQHGGMQALIKVVLGGSDVVVKLHRDGPPQVVDDAEHQIAVWRAVHDDAQGAHIVNLFEGQLLAHHFAVYAVDVFGASSDDCLVQFVVRQLLAQSLGHHLQILLTVNAAFVHAGRDAPILLRMQVTEAEVFQFPLELPDAQQIGQRRKEIHRVLRDAHLLFRRHVAQGAHVVQAVRQLDENDTHVVAHRQHHLAQIMLIAIVAPLHRVRKRQVGETRDPVYQRDNIAPELAFQFRACDAGIFQRIVQQSGSNGLGIHVDLRQDARHRDTVREERFPGFAPLVFVQMLGPTPGTFHERAIMRRNFRQSVQQAFPDSIHPHNRTNSNLQHSKSRRVAHQFPPGRMV